MPRSHPFCLLHRASCGTSGGRGVHLEASRSKTVLVWTAQAVCVHHRCMVDAVVAYAHDTQSPQSIRARAPGGRGAAPIPLFTCSMLLDQHAYGISRGESRSVVCRCPDFERSDSRRRYGESRDREGCVTLQYIRYVSPFSSVEIEFLRVFPSRRPTKGRSADLDRVTRSDLRLRLGRSTYGLYGPCDRTENTDD